MNVEFRNFLGMERHGHILMAWRNDTGDDMKQRIMMSLQQHEALSGLVSHKPYL